MKQLFFVILLLIITTTGLFASGTKAKGSHQLSAELKAISSYALQIIGNPASTSRAAPIGTLAIDVGTDNPLLYMKVGVSSNDWVSVPFLKLSNTLGNNEDFAMTVTGSPTGLPTGLPTGGAGCTCPPTGSTTGDVTGTDVTGTDVTGTDVTGTDVTGTDVTGTDVTGTDVTGTDVTGTDVTGITTGGSTGGYVTACSCGGGTYTGDVTGTDVTGTDVTGCVTGCSTGGEDVGCSGGGATCSPGCTGVTCGGGCTGVSGCSTGDDGGGGGDTGDGGVGCISPEPTITPIGTLCVGQPVYLIDYIQGDNLLWYSSSIDPTGSPNAPPVNTSITGTQTFYVSQTTDDCIESTLATVTVQIVSQLSCPNGIVQINNPSGGASPFDYNQVQIVVQGGLAPYNFDWDITGYVRYEIKYNGNSATITIYYAEGTDWTVAVSDDATQCNSQIPLVFTNDANGNTELNIDAYDITEDSGTNNGAVNIFVSGGCNGYTYAWDGPNGFTAATQDIANLASGWYHVVVSCGNESAEGWYWIGLSHRGRKTDMGNSINRPLAKV